MRKAKRREKHTIVISFAKEKKKREIINRYDDIMFGTSSFLILKHRKAKIQSFALKLKAHGVKENMQTN